MKTGTSGEANFLNVDGGRHRVRVIAGDRRKVVRRRVILMPDDAEFCSLNAINNGVTKTLHPNGTVLSYTVEFRRIGFDAGFICFVNRDSPAFFPCECNIYYNNSVTSPTEIMIIISYIMLVYDHILCSLQAQVLS